MDWGKPMNLTAEDFRLAVGESRQFPVMHMVNSVITKKAMEEVRVVDGLVCLEPGDERIFAFLVDRHGEWVTPGLVRGFGQGIDGLASSYTGSQDLLVLGRDSEAMAQAANFVVEMGGGIAWIQGGECAFALPLPILGAMSVEPVDALIAKLEPFVEKLREHGFTHLDPLYTLMFLSSTHLPQIRLTKRGLMLVKEKKILIPAKARA
jgi:adenine deaminase